MTGIFTSKVAERTAEIKAQRESKRPQVVGATQVSLPGPTVRVCVHKRRLFLPPSPAFCRVCFAFHREVLLSQMKEGLLRRGAHLAPTERARRAAATTGQQHPDVLSAWTAPGRVKHPMINTLALKERCIQGRRGLTCQS